MESEAEVLERQPVVPLVLPNMAEQQGAKAGLRRVAITGVVQNSVQAGAVVAALTTSRSMGRGLAALRARTIPPDTLVAAAAPQELTARLLLLEPPELDLRLYPVLAAEEEGHQTLPGLRVALAGLAAFPAVEAAAAEGVTVAAVARAVMAATGHAVRLSSFRGNDSRHSEKPTPR
jgi:hypothetical protein